MSLNIKKLYKKPQVFLRLTGVSIDEFHTLCYKAQPLWQTHVRESKKVCGRPFGLIDMETHILCLLLYYRTYITQEFIGFLCDVDDSCICRSLRRTSQVLAPALGMNKRRTVSAEEAMKLIIDCTEQRIQRPLKKQRKYYSGKRKAHTLKTELQVTDKGQIVHISPPHPGRRHDRAIRAQGPPLRRNATVYVDSGYQGLHKDHGNTYYPYKKSKNKPLSDQEKMHNRELASFRVRVEHKIRQLKTFQYMGQVHRNRRRGYGIAVNIIAGIVNMKAGF